MRNARWIAVVTAFVLEGCSTLSAIFGCPQHTITIGAVPQSTAPMALYQLVQEQQPSSAWVEQMLRESTPDATLRPLDAGADRTLSRVPMRLLQAHFEEGQLRAWFDTTNGDAIVFPRMRRLQPMSTQAQQIAEKSTIAALSRLDLGTAEKTSELRYQAQRTTTVYAAEMSSTGTSTSMTPGSTQAKLMYRRAQRMVGPYRVEGPGSRAVVGIGADGQLESFTRAWRRAEKVDLPITPLDENEVIKQIREQVEPFRPSGDINVKIDIAYYDANQTYIQPVYRFIVRITNSANEQPVLMVGYAPYMKEWEQLPKLASPALKLDQPQNSGGVGPNHVAPAIQPLTGTRPVRIARYVFRPSSEPTHPEFRASAMAFWTGIRAGTGIVDTAFVDEATSEDLTTNLQTAQSEVVLVEAHGQPRRVFMSGLFDDPIEFSTLTLPRTPGAPATDLILHSCAVIPSPVDDANWAKPWLGVLGAARTVVGYRTNLYYSDGAMAAYSAELRNRGAIIGSWLHEVASLSTYEDDASFPVGKPAALGLCANQYDTIYDPIERAAPTCIAIWWIN
jgi:hypothetical protein